MNSVAGSDIAVSARYPARLGAVPASRGQRDARDPQPRTDAGRVVPLRPAGLPGHGWATSLRRQSAWIAQDHKGRYTGLFEIICCGCGDHPYLEYSDLPPRLQQVRGPYTLEAGLVAFAEHSEVVHSPARGPTRPGRSAAGDAVTSPEAPGTATGPRPAAAPAPRSPHDPRDPWLRVDAEDVAGLPLAGQPGHGRTASLRRQPARILDGRMEGGYTDAFELLCPSCGDHPYLDYSEVSPRLQQIRGPYTLEAGLAAYAGHLGPDSPAPPGQRQAAGSSNGKIGNSAGRPG